MGWLDNIIQHQQNSMPRGYDIEEGELKPDGCLHYTVTTKDGETVEYSLSQEESQRVFRGWEQKKRGWFS